MVTKMLSSNVDISTRSTISSSPPSYQMSPRNNHDNHATRNMLNGSSIDVPLSWVKEEHEEKNIDGEVSWSEVAES